MSHKKTFEEVASNPLLRRTTVYMKRYRESHPEYVEIGSSKIGWTVIVLGIVGMVVVPVIWLFI